MESGTKTQSVVQLTPSAATEAKVLGEKPENAGKHLRVYVEAGGCSGMQYGLVFDQQRENDLVHDCHGVSVLVDPFSADYLRGVVIDFSDDLNSSGFHMTNPNARQSCGCGRSFEA